MFKLYDDKVNLPEIEKEILSFWRDNSTFEKSIVSREGKPAFTFYEGPPTANGIPGIHHVISRAIKDLMCRYKTLRGFQVYRKAGWDTQGLPVEIEVEKKLGIKSKDDIEKLGVKKFNEECKASVFKYLKEWEALTERMGYWLNLDEAYITYTNNYIESVWWALKRFFDEGLIYKGYKIQPYCPRCETPLSTHEVAQGYEDVKDPSVYVKFKIDNSDFEGYSFLVWTTTPWTLISNVALSVNPEITYVKIKLSNGEMLVLAKERLSVISEEYEIVEEFPGANLERIKYRRLFDYIPVEKDAFYVTLGDFVTTSDGSGIVHIAPAFGEDDYNISRKYDLPVLQPVDKSGKFVEAVTDFKNRFVKEADEDIISSLKAAGKLYKKEKFIHSYPHCWRCHTPLLYYARESWYINTSSYKDKMIKINNEISWYPPETGSGRFGNWLEENRDWALSRDRYWGTPLPIWGCNCDDCPTKYISVGSIDELREKAVNFYQVYENDSTVDVHKPMIDEIKLKCPNCSCKLTRVTEVIDAWFDSGSMPFAQHHYPFENEELFKQNYPADFIAEAIDQTRGWFYSLHAIGTFLFNDKAFKNLIVNAHILDKDGQKMSKHKGNIVDPFAVMDKHGADILRWYLITSSPPWRSKAFNEDDLAEVRNKFFDTVLNTYRFFAMYFNTSGYKMKDLENRIVFNDRPEIDRWILSALNSLKKNYISLMDSYDITKAARAVADFTTEDLSNWYVRRNRKRYRSQENTQDKLTAFQTLHEVLSEVVKLISPFSPFISEELFKNLTGYVSVHLSYIEEPSSDEIDEKLESEMKLAQRIVYLVRALRVQSNLKIRQPLKQILIPPSNDEQKAAIEKIKNIILEEVNVKELKFIDENSGIIVKKAKPNFKLLGPKLGKDIKKAAEIIKELDTRSINEIERSGKGIINLNGEEIEITIDEIEVMTENIEGWLVESHEGITVALDVKLDENLRYEGFAREFISKVQNLRKDRKYSVNDRIRIKYFCGDELNEAINKQKNYIRDEIMAEDIAFDKEIASNGYEKLNINGIDCSVSVEKV